MPKARIKVEKDHVEAQSLPVVFFREGDTFIAHSPLLDLSACGETFEEAQKNFSDAASIFFTECAERGTLAQALESCGWSVDDVSDNKRKISPPLYVGHGRIPVDVPEFA